MAECSALNGVSFAGELVADEEAFTTLSMISQCRCITLRTIAADPHSVVAGVGSEPSEDLEDDQSDAFGEHGLSSAVWSCCGYVRSDPRITAAQTPLSTRSPAWPNRTEGPRVCAHRHPWRGGDAAGSSATMAGEQLPVRGPVAQDSTLSASDRPGGSPPLPDREHRTAPPIFPHDEVGGDVSAC
jgi:hypothetical protein